MGPSFIFHDISKEMNLPYHFNGRWEKYRLVCHSVLVGWKNPVCKVIIISSEVEFLRKQLRSFRDSLVSPPHVYMSDYLYNTGDKYRSC